MREAGAGAVGFCEDFGSSGLQVHVVCGVKVRQVKTHSISNSEMWPSGLRRRLKVLLNRRSSGVGVSHHIYNFRGCSNSQ